MDQPGLKLVRHRPRRGEYAPRWAVFAAGGALLLAALLATVGGADEARRSIPSRRLAESAVQRSLEMGNEDPQVRGSLLRLRRSLSRRPLDCRTRVVYASLLLGLSRSLTDTRAAAFHAGLAAELAPVTVPVVRTAALVLARSRELDGALDWIRFTFGHDPAAAAELLAEVEPLLFDSQLDRGLDETPQAWLAWSEQLRRDDRDDEADLRLRRSHERWPDHLPTLQRLAARAAADDDRAALEALFPPGRDLPAEAAAAPLLAYRARLRGMQGDASGAREDIDRALALGEGRDGLRILAGDAYAALGDDDAAKRIWNLELHGLRSPAVDTRVGLLARLARLEDRHGQAAAALRLWRSVLELNPEHPAAQKRVDELTGFHR